LTNGSISYFYFLLESVKNFQVVDPAAPVRGNDKYLFPTMLGNWVFPLVQHYPDPKSIFFLFYHAQFLMSVFITGQHKCEKHIKNGLILNSQF